MINYGLMLKVMCDMVIICVFIQASFIILFFTTVNNNDDRIIFFCLCMKHLYFLFFVKLYSQV